MNGILVLCLAKMKLEKTFMRAKAGSPKAKQNSASAEFFTLKISKDPYPKSAEVICSDEIKSAKVAGKHKNKLSSRDLF